jgi:hypothetical protein
VEHNATAGGKSAFEQRMFSFARQERMTRKNAVRPNFALENSCPIIAPRRDPRNFAKFSFGRFERFQWFRSEKIWKCVFQVLSCVPPPQIGGVKNVPPSS